MAFVTVGLSGVALAQSTSRSTFAPSLTLLGSLSSNPLRLVGDPRESGFVAVSADLPFRLRGPRWSADFSYTPGYQRYSDSQIASSFEQSGRMFPTSCVGSMLPRSSYRDRDRREPTSMLRSCIS